MATSIMIRNLTKYFGTVKAVDNVSLDIEPGTFLTILGPSGCGKTTLLRCVAGLEDPDEGEIYIDQKLVYSDKKKVNVCAGERELGLVFQNYALWPHMNVYQNMAFGLEIKKLPRAEIKQRIHQSLAEVQMEGYAERYPREMSGGQQQRIALARMLAYRPKVFLLDEPLSNLDARLRLDMRAEIKRLHRVSVATTLYVTHDQVEAMTMASSIAIMKDGVVQQMATPDQIYHFPTNLFVADFIGNPKINLLPGVVSQTNRVDLETFRIHLPTHQASGEVVLAIRPEDIQVSTEPAPEAVEFTAYSILPSGSDSTIIARLGKTDITIRETGISNIKVDEKIWLNFNPRTINLYQKESGNLISS